MAALISLYGCGADALGPAEANDWPFDLRGKLAVMVQALEGQLGGRSLGAVFVVRGQGQVGKVLHEYRSLGCCSPLPGSALAWSPDGQALAYETHDNLGETWLTRVNRDDTQVFLNGGTNPAYRADGVLAYSTDPQPCNGNCGVELEGREVFRCACDLRTLQWASNGSDVALLDPGERSPAPGGGHTIPGRGVYLIDTGGPAATPLLLDAQFGARIVDAAPSPTDEVLAIAVEGGSASGIWVLRQDGSDLRQVATAAATALTWSDDGRVILFTRGDSAIWAVQFEGGSPVAVWESSRGGNILALAWTGR